MRPSTVLPLVLLLLLPLVWSRADAAYLEVGVKPPGWHLSDGEGRQFSPGQFPGKVVIISHLSPHDAEVNTGFNDAVKQAVLEGALDEARLQGLGVADCAASWMPDALIRSIGRAKAKKYQAVVLFDTNATVRTLWGLTAKAPVTVILDKQGSCRFVTMERIKPESAGQIIGLIRKLQDE